MKLLRLAALLAAAGLAVILINTSVAFYKGTGSVGATGPDEGLVRVRVESCERVGPLRDWQLGFWWVCQVRLPDGGQVEVDRSIVTKDDIGQAVDLYQACYKPPSAHCTLGNQASAFGQVYAGGLRLIERVAVLIVAGWAFTYLLAAAVGARRFVGFIAWWGRRR